VQQGDLAVPRSSARSKPAKVEALGNFFVETLSNPAWQLDELY
jgi:hypothetical protein